MPSYWAQVKAQIKLPLFSFILLKDRQPFISIALSGTEVNAEVGQDVSFITGSLSYNSISIISNHNSLYPTLIDTKFVDQFGSKALEINFEINKQNSLPIKAEIKSDAQMLIVANAEVIFEIQKYFDIKSEIPNIDYYTTGTKQAALKYVNQGTEFLV